jgi:hypothetical protein
LAIWLRRIRGSIGIALIVVAGLAMSATMLSADPVGSALCGIESSPVFNLMSLMPVYFAMMIIGIGDNARHYAKYFLTEGYSQKDLKRLFLGFVVSGGSVYRKDGKYCIRYYGKDAGMHRMFNDLAYSIYGSRPQTVHISQRGTYMSQLYSKSAVREVCEFSPEMASRKGETPTITYILEGDRRVKAEATRVVMSTAGWITCNFLVTDGRSKVYPRLGFGSVLDVNLACEYTSLMEAVPLRMRRYENKKYQGKGYLATTEQEDMRSFCLSGGFYEGSTVKKGAFSGVEKSRLLQALIDGHGTEYATKANAIETLNKSCDSDARDLSIYMDRIMLG